MMKPTAKNPAGWSAVRQHFATWEKAALLGLIKDLYDAGAENRVFLQARCQAEEGGGAALESYRKRIVEQFFPARGGVGKLKLGEARKAIRDYRKATGHLAGTAELLMTYVEQGAEFTRVYGDIDERFYSSIESALEELATLPRGEAALYQPMADRLAGVEQATAGVGWGFHDYIGDVVLCLEEELGGA